MLITAQASSLYSARLIQKLHKETGRQLVVYVDHVVHVNRHIAYSIYTLFNYYLLPYSIHFPFTIIPESPQPLSRPCPFCDRFVQDLRRHFMTTHKHNDRVKVINDESSGRTSKQQRMLSMS